MKQNYLRFILIMISLSVFTFAASAQTGKNSGKGKKPLKDKPLKIKSRIQPNENILVECMTIRIPSQIYVGVLVKFDSSGKVTDAEIVGSSGCPEFDEECLRVAKKIKFNPEIKSGVPVTVVKPITYIISLRRT